MEPATGNVGQLAAHFRDRARRLLVIGDNRLELAAVRTLTDQTKSPGSIATSAVDPVAGLAVFQRARPVNAGVKTSWLATILNGADLISTVWLTVRSFRRGRENKPSKPQPRPACGFSTQ